MVRQAMVKISRGAHLARYVSRNGFFDHQRVKDNIMKLLKQIALLYPFQIYNFCVGEKAIF